MPDQVVVPNPLHQTSETDGPMEPDKRQFVRKRTDQLLYAEFGPDNGSILLNLCKDGCSFQSMAPVREDQVRFWVSVGDGRKLEGEGRMVWSDATKKTGGIRFLNPSAELQEQVYAWLKETIVTTDGQLDAAAIESQAKRRRKELREKARAEASITWNEGAQRDFASRPAAANEEQIPRKKPPNETAESPSLSRPVISAGWPDESRVGRRTARGSWWGLSTLAAVAILFLALVTYRRELGHLAMSMGSSLAGEEQKSDPTAGSAEASAVSEGPRTEVQPIALSEVHDTIEPGAEAVSASVEQVASAAPAPNPKHSSVPPASRAGDVATLWTSVENGDTGAEVMLANRYVRGDGVPQSCAQARVLLEAAVKRGSAEARQKLDELPQSGCP